MEWAEILENWGQERGPLNWISSAGGGAPEPQSPSLGWPSQTHRSLSGLGAVAPGLTSPPVKRVDWTHCSPGGLPAQQRGGRAGGGGPERRPLQLRFNEPSIQLKLIKTRLEPQPCL